MSTIMLYNQVFLCFHDYAIFRSTSRVPVLMMTFSSCFCAKTMGKASTYLNVAMLRGDLAFLVSLLYMLLLILMNRSALWFCRLAFLSSSHSPNATRDLWPTSRDLDTFLRSGRSPSCITSCRHAKTTSFLFNQLRSVSYVEMMYM